MSQTIQIASGDTLEKGFDTRAAMDEASRCLLCIDAPCSQSCPAGTDPGKFIRSLRFQNIWGAAETIRENNPLGASCSWICPVNQLCEGACARTALDKPVAIGKLQRFITGQEQKQGMKIIQAGTPNGKKIACIGADPASLACASALAREGCSVTVFEADSQPGGMLTQGIPPFRLPQNIVEHDIAKIRELGVQFICNQRITSADIDSLFQEYDAIFIGTGLWQSRTLDLPGKELDGVTTALSILKQARETQTSEQGNHIVVIGDGDVAMDCATTATQLGAASVKLVYCRPIAEASANISETILALKMGVPVMTEFFPTAISGKNGKVTGITFTGANGQSSMTLKADKIIMAVGQECNDDLAILKYLKPSATL